MRAVPTVVVLYKTSVLSVTPLITSSRISAKYVLKQSKDFKEMNYLQSSVQTAAHDSNQMKQHSNHYKLKLSASMKATRSMEQPLKNIQI